MIPDAIAKATTHTAAAIAAGELLAAQPIILDIGRTKMAYVPTGLNATDLEKLLPSPAALRQNVTLDTPEALIGYVNLFGQKDRSLIFAKRANRNFVAALDYHGTPTDPSWITHRATCTLQPTKEWLDWEKQDGEHVDQETFAQFIEEHVSEIATPDGATLLEMVSGFEAKKDVNFISARRISDGAIQFTYNEDVQASNHGGTMKVPSVFNLVIAPFEGSTHYEVTARLRYRIPNGKLELWYDLLRPDLIVDQAFADVVSHVKTSTEASIRAVLLGNL